MAQKRQNHNDDIENESSKGARSEARNSQRDEATSASGNASEGRQSAQGQNQTQGRNLQQGGGNDVWAKVVPALTEAQNYIEANPGRAVLLGAAIGGLAMGVIASPRSRNFIKTAYQYANPSLEKYVREAVAKAAGNMAEKSLLQ